MDTKTTALMIEANDKINELRDENMRLKQEREDYMKAVRVYQNQNARLREALKPFADAAISMFNDWCPDETPAWHDAEESASSVTVGDFRRAHEASKN